MVEHDSTVETICHCLVRKDVLPMDQKQNVVRIFSSEVKESLLNDCHETAVEHV